LGIFWIFFFVFSNVNSTNLDWRVCCPLSQCVNRDFTELSNRVGFETMKS
jgi:hypothetical protein